MRRQSDGPEQQAVDCIACGRSVPIPAAREYDRYGDCWERPATSDEHLCRECYRSLSHEPRQGLEALLSEIEAPDQSRGEFLARYVDAIESRVEDQEPEAGSDS